MSNSSKRNTGRPPLPTKREKAIGIRLTETERFIIVERARRMGMNFTTYIRQMAEVFQDPQGQKYLHQLDSQYNANPEQFRKQVSQQEKIEQERVEDFQRVQESQEEIKNLQDKWSRQPGRKSK